MFKLTRSGSSWNFTKVAQSQPTDWDNSGPVASLVISGGNLYGTANGNTAEGGLGAVFEVTPQGTMTDLVDFNGSNGSWADSSESSTRAEISMGRTYHGVDAGTIYELSSSSQYHRLTQVKPVR